MVIALGTLLGPATPGWAVDVAIPDANLEAELRAAVGLIGGGPIQDSDLASLGGFTANGKNIVDLTGMEACVNLTYLDLGNNAITNIAPLTGLTDLQFLYLNINAIEDISPLAGMSVLQQLDLAVNQFHDVTPLAGKTSLTYLNISDNRVAEIGPLANLTNLTSLDIEVNRISDVSPLSGLTSLDTLEAWGNLICDVSPLVANPGFTAGDTIILFDNPLSAEDCGTNIPAFAGRNVTVDAGAACSGGGLATCPVPVVIPDPNLEAAVRGNLNIPSGPLFSSDLATITFLSAISAGITDLTGLEYCTALQELDLYGNPISNLAPLAGLTSLERLNLFLNQVSNLSPLSGLTNLRDLSLGSNLVTDISALAGMSQLTHLDLFDNDIADISPLENIDGLEVVSLFNNRVSDLSPLANKSDLLDLSLGRNPLGDLTPLASLSSIETLDLTTCGITDISALAGLLSLENLLLSDNRIRDISAVAGMSNLTLLHLNNNLVSSLAPLSEIFGLQSFQANNNRIIDVSPLAASGLLDQVFVDNNQVCSLRPLLDSPGLSSGDTVRAEGNPLSLDSCDSVTSVLTDRGILVNTGDTCAGGSGLPECPTAVLYVEPGGEGDGTWDSPFGGIQFALDWALEIGQGKSISILVAPGVYEEVLNIPPNVHIIGSGQSQTRIAPRIDQLGGVNPTAIQAGDGSSIEAVNVALHPLSPPATLLSIGDVAFSVDDVLLLGNGAANSTGIRIIGSASSDSLIKDSMVLQVDRALAVDNSAARFAFNVFESIFGPEAVRISSQGAMLPELGNIEDLVNTGSNVFTNIQGRFIINGNPLAPRAQANYWDNLPRENMIAIQLQGGADVSLPLFTLDGLKGGIPSATLVATVVDDNTDDPISGAQVTIVANVSNLPMSVAGVYVAPALPQGRYTVRARKSGYEDQVRLMDVFAGANAVTLRMGGAPGGGEQGIPLVHSGDTNGNTRIDLTEVLRIIQLYNAPGFSCGGGDADGYQIGPGGGQACQSHGADYSGGTPNWRLSLSEVLRMLQFFNSGGYYRCAGNTEDGYCPKEE